MNARDRITDVGDRVIARAKSDIESLKPYLEGPPLGARALTPQEHALWMQKVVAAKLREYPPQQYMTPKGPVFNSIWLLTRPFVKGWEGEISRFDREVTGMMEAGNASS